MKMLELYSGSGKISQAFESAGYFSVSVDNRRRKGVCEPTMRADIATITIEDLPHDHYDVIWIGLPCDVWTYAAGGFHWTPDGLPKTKKCLKHISLLHHTLNLLEQLLKNARDKNKRSWYFIENPRGRLRNFEYFNQWLKRNEGITYTVTLSSYGFPTTKPTNIFTNLDNWIVRPLAEWGRGAKCPKLFNNMTTAQRQATPVELITDIIHVLEANQNAGRISRLN